MKTLVNTQRESQGANSSDSLLLGMQAGPWLIEEELGRGGMGIVFGVTHAQIGKRAALKVMHRRLYEPMHAERMLLEAQVVNAIGHPNIVDIFDVGTMPDGRPYIVMERLTGHSLADCALDVEGALTVLLHVCDALIAAHAAGVVHRDLKPDNIFLVGSERERPRIKLLDWGIARMLHTETKHTCEGLVMGTPRYVAPEQARGERVTTQTDVYSLGVVAYELMLGQPPFDAPTAAELMAMHLLMQPRTPRALWPSIPWRLESLLLSMLAKEPEERPAMTEVAARLGEIRDAWRARRIALEPDVYAAPDPDDVHDSHDERDDGSRTGDVRRRKVMFGAATLAAALGVSAFTLRSEVPAKRAAAEPVAQRAATAPAVRATTPFTNPVLHDCADPSVLRDGTRWYMACTGTRAGQVYPIYTSDDLQSWRRVAAIFPDGSRPAWAKGHYWAPELRKRDDGFAAYFSMRGTGRRNAIGVAHAAAPSGPFADRGAPILTPPAGASDAHVLATEGRHFLYYKDEAQPASIWVQELAADGITPRGTPTRVVAPTQAWEGGNVEAPAVIRDGDYFYLFYSGARYCDPSYALGVARARSPLGPFEKQPQPIIKSGGAWVAPGHAAFTEGLHGERYIVYHAYQRVEGVPTCKTGADEDNNRRHVRIDAMDFANGWPRIAAQL